jgi:hypothetical protein
MSLEASDDPVLENTPPTFCWCWPTSATAIPDGRVAATGDGPPSALFAGINR